MPQITYTPMIQQYLKIKEDYADAVVFFRLGDFYEMFFDDAIIASKILEIQLTSRDAGTKIPMCGIPFHASKAYIQKLIDKGLKIAIAEQVSEPGKGLVERKVIRVITPGTVYEEDILKSSDNNFIASIILNELGYQVTYVDISTGEAFLKEALSLKKVMQALLDLNIKEVVYNQAFDLGMTSFLEENHILVSHTKPITDLKHPLLNQCTNVQKQGVLILLSYLSTTQIQALEYIDKITVLDEEHLLYVDSRAKKHLEIFTSLQNTTDKTLIAHLDQTKTSAGSRLLKHYLNHPLTDLEVLTYRQNVIESFIGHFAESDDLSKYLNDTYDLSRIVGRVVFGSANPRDLYYLKKTLAILPEIKKTLLSFDAQVLTEMSESIDTHQSLLELLDQAIEDMPPIHLKEGGVIKSGYHPHLDELRKLKDEGSLWLENFERDEKERTGIRNLKVGFSKNFGYFIEISKAQAQMVTEAFGYERKQTLVNNERFISPILKAKEDDLLHAEERSLELENTIFNELKGQTLAFQYSLNQVSHVLAKIDVFLNLSILAQKHRYVRPELSVLDRSVKVLEGRHPVVEQYTTFISNDVLMHEGEIFMITGPNMSGKSTYMRMYALIVYMAQIGSFVPANYAKMPIYDALFTRIGSSDDLSGGKSTFMVEMVESNEALTFATPNSLIIFDEIGRGTATFDGMALASAMIEYIYKHIKAQTFFSTHYHEITALADQYEYITNLHVKAMSSKDNITFLHKIELGATDRSYGILVAKLANLPKEVITRSQQTLKVLERQKAKETNLFNYVEEPIETDVHIPPILKAVMDAFSQIDIDKMTPMDALNWLHLKKKQLDRMDKDDHDGQN